jgi:SET domain-containing protein 6
MFENSKSDSKWRPYLDILPEKLNSPLFWTEDELKWLKGTTIEDTIGMGICASFTFL